MIAVLLIVFLLAEVVIRTFYHDDVIVTTA